MFNTNQELKKWISNYIEEKGKKSLHIAINNSKEIKSDIIKFTTFLPDDIKINQRCYHILQDIIEIPLCKECKSKKVNFNNRNKDWIYLEFCSTKCSTINKDVIKKYKNTNIERYGVDNISKSKFYHDFMIKNNNDKYGVDWYQQSDDFRKKSILTCLKKYGVDSYTKTDEFKDKIKKTLIERYDVDWYSKSKEFKEKFISKSLEKYGTEHPMLNTEFKENVSNSMLKKYGKDWYVLTNDFKEKSFKSKEERYGSPTGGFKLKEYKLPSGKIVIVQGYEHYALDILLKTYKEEELSISYFDIKYEIGTLNYIMAEADRIYLPDIYIKSENKIIEVKSDYTYNLEIEKNILKKECCISLGMKFEFWIIDNKGKLSEVK
jgi:hypothetical protein